MDASTTLIAFMLQTMPDIESVVLIGSWDNFATRYPMERDARRAHGQWRGTFAFKDIICDGVKQGESRNGGLKMGQEYWFYYELDGEIEWHDSTLPSTTSCPFLPGQPVNILQVPTRKPSVRSRSGSLSSILTIHPQTLRPEDKYLKLRALEETLRPTRLDTSPALFMDSSFSLRSTRSVSPKKMTWSPRRLFGFRSPSSVMSPTVQDKDHITTTPSPEPFLHNRNTCNGSSVPTSNVRLSACAQAKVLSPFNTAALPSHTIPIGWYSASQKSSMMINEDRPTTSRHIYAASHPNASRTRPIPDSIVMENYLAKSDDYDEDDFNFANRASFSYSPSSTPKFDGLCPPPSRRTLRPVRDKSVEKIFSSPPYARDSTMKPLPRPPRSPLSFFHEQVKKDRRKGIIPIEIYLPHSSSFSSPASSPTFSQTSTPGSKAGDPLNAIKSSPTIYRLPSELVHSTVTIESRQTQIVEVSSQSDNNGSQTPEPQFEGELSLIHSNVKGEKEWLDDLGYLGSCIVAREVEMI